MTQNALQLVRITTAGAVTLETCAATDTGDTLRAIVGGWIEALDLGDDGTLWLHEEAKLSDPPAPHNAIAERLHMHFGGGLGPGDWLSGDAAVTGPPSPEGETTSVTPKVLDALARLGYPASQPTD
jgi:hypothetical protein